MTATDCLEQQELVPPTRLLLFKAGITVESVVDVDFDVGVEDDDEAAIGMALLAVFGRDISLDCFMRTVTKLRDHRLYLYTKGKSGGGAFFSYDKRN